MSKLDQAGVGKISGVFSTEKTVRIGTGTTSRKVRQTSYYYVTEIEDDQVQVQPLSHDHIPAGPKDILTKDELLENYLPEPTMYQNQVLPKLRDVQKHVARADRFRKQGNSFSAEMEYSNALKLDEQNIRANFGIGLCYIARGDNEKAQEVFERVVTIDAAFEDEHKHLFNEFGINLRKTGMYDEAVEYYERAAELSQDDENIHYNLARAAFEKKDPKKTMHSLRKCLNINPTHQEALQFVDYLKKKRLA